ncbi:hypothetical protein F4827_001724 [Paraburkholderia bannensis]|uniref:Uncharacterized protein n=1 Tax=Paraburkholderia bannensis TaxID=765414 RepID=A0A7W9WS26_9BURK|nr:MULTISPECIES: hypothetical protein [Paraburkholderia]MBB3256922.1 hypothetical protein [Paraburkholderia sp. WP4_3_2]MBB6101876.1 hypothetical protein [Paraburkholderia bannensis]
MNFALLLSSLPHVDEARGHYDRMLALHERTPGRAAQRIAQLWQRLTHSFS